MKSEIHHCMLCELVVTESISGILINDWSAVSIVHHIDYDQEIVCLFTMPCF